VFKTRILDLQGEAKNDPTPKMWLLSYTWIFLWWILQCSIH